MRRIMLAVAFTLLLCEPAHAGLLHRLKMIATAPVGVPKILVQSYDGGLCRYWLHQWWTDQTPW